MNVGAVLELESTHLRKTDNHLEFVENKYKTYSSLHSYIKRIPGRSSFFFFYPSLAIIILYIVLSPL